MQSAVAGGLDAGSVGECARPAISLNADLSRSIIVVAVVGIGSDVILASLGSAGCRSQETAIHTLGAGHRDMILFHQEAGGVKEAKICTRCTSHAISAAL